MRRSNQRGIALITVMLVMMLMSALMVGFTAVVISDQRFRFIDQDRSQAFYAANAGVEKMTTDLGNLFFVNIAPTTAQIRALTVAAKLPTITGVTFVAPVAPGILPTSPLSATNCVAPNAITTVGANGYTIKFCAAAGGNPTPVMPPKPIKSGPYEGLVALQTPYQIDATARTRAGGEVHLIRSMESVAIPVFQFGIFSDVDQSFFAGPTFNFGGRVHTNGNLFVSQGDGTTLTFTDRVTAVGAVVRQVLQNGISIDTPSGHTGTVNVAKGGGAVRALARTEGSVVDNLASAANGNWPTISRVDYNGWLRNGVTDAKPLKLALLSAGGSNPDLIRRPLPGENTSNPALFGERLFNKASLRIMLSDTAANITGVPGVTSTAPVLLDKDWTILANVPTNATGTYGAVNATHPAIAGTPGSMTTKVLGGTSAADYHVQDITVFLPVLRLAGLPVFCDEKTATGFSGCVISAAIVAANPLSMTGAPGAPPLAIASITAGGNQTISVTAGSLPNLAAYKPTPFWSGANQVSCTGWAKSPAKYTGCSGAPAPAVGTLLSNLALSATPTSLIGGYLKIERQTAAGTWADVTIEILNYGIGGPNLDGASCGDPTPDAILRLQRFKDNTPAEGGCSYSSSATGTGYWPNVLFDPREALVRDTSIGGGSNLPLGGVIHYIILDVKNLSKWFTATAPFAGGTGANSRTDNGGFTVYFSDRRNNRNAAGQETGEYGWEDVVNPTSSTGAPNDVLDAGEDLNSTPTSTPTLETYGKFPSYNGVPSSVPPVSAPGAGAPLDVLARPSTLLNRREAQANRAVLFRRALKLTNGQDIRGLGVTGLTIASENPVYIHGNWNANGTFAGPHAATAVIADAVTLLTALWNDTISFTMPYNPGARSRYAESWYRLGIIAGKGRAFPHPAGTETDFGTDGGAHNFLRHLQDGDKALNYRGSIATFYYSRQAVGTYKCCTTVFNPPDRNYAFDSDFLNPALLPPNTPAFRDVNAVGFAQELRPGR